MAFRNANDKNPKRHSREGGNPAPSVREAYELESVPKLLF